MSSTPPRPHKNPPPQPSKTHPTALLSPHASLSGSHPITLAANAIVHLRAKIVSVHGPVEIGEGCIVSERACVGLGGGGVGGGGGSGSDGSGGGRGVRGDGGRGVVLEKGVVVETGAVVEARLVGEGSVVGVGAWVGGGAVLGKHCKIGPLCTIPPDSVLADFTVVYGNNERRVERPGLETVRASYVQKHVEVLRALMGGKGGKMG